MQLRTYLRTVFYKVLEDNLIINVVKGIVNFYCNIWFPDHEKVKFEENIPTSYMDTKRNMFFQSITGDKIDCK